MERLPSGVADLHAVFCHQSVSPAVILECQLEVA